MNKHGYFKNEHEYDHEKANILYPTHANKGCEEDVGKKIKKTQSSEAQNISINLFLKHICTSVSNIFL